jgi:hypothetical protein
VLATRSLRLHRGRLEVALPAPDARGGAVLVLRSGERRVRVPLVLSHGVLEADFGVGEQVPTGTWSMWVHSRHPGSTAAARVRLASVDAGPWRLSSGKLVRLTSVGGDAWVRLWVLTPRKWARREVARVLGRYRGRQGAATA